MKTSLSAKSFTATRNACNLCAPLGAALAFKGLANSVPLLHGSQGCSTYIRRYMISHFKEPLDIACSNFGEDTAIFGGGANLKLAIDNIRRQYEPEIIGVATTCLSETIGDDVPMFLAAYKEESVNESLPALVHVATPSYRGTHAQGFHAAVRALAASLAEAGPPEPGRVNLFPGMVSPSDLRELKQTAEDFGLSAVLVPDISDTLNGPLWTEYQKIPAGGTELSALRGMGSASASIECGLFLAGEKDTAGTTLEKRFGVPLHRPGLPIGIRETDRFLEILSRISGRPVPEKQAARRGRLLDSLVDAHKHLNGVRAALFGDEDLVAGLAGFCSELGIVPVVCATGGGNGRFERLIKSVLPERLREEAILLADTDFSEIQNAAEKSKVDILIGHSKGYSMARELDVPLVRVGFPVHDRVDGSRILHLGYRGAQQLFDRIVNTLIEAKQEKSPVGYTYW